MADIDKALPNEPRKTFEVPGEEEIQEQIVETIKEEQASPDAVEVTRKRRWISRYKLRSTSCITRRW